MAVEFENSQTKKNLEAAFAGESQATNKYSYYASQAAKDGYQQISNIFTETSGNEKVHAKLWFKYLHGGKIPETAENLKDAAAGENYAKFRLVGNIEKTHEERYQKLLERVESGEVFEREGVKVWKCLKCGHLHVGASAPKVCPVCGHPQAYFEEQSLNY